MDSESSSLATLKVLVIEDNPDDAVILQDYLGQSDSPRFLVEQVSTLAHGMRRLQASQPDVLLLDLSLMDSRGIDTVTRAREEAPDVPIVVLTGLNDEDVAVRALREGAQDYLVKSRVDSSALVRSIRYAIQRHRIQKGLQQARKEYDTREVPSLSSLAGGGLTVLPAEVFGPRALVAAQSNDLAEHLAETLRSALGPGAKRSGVAVSARLRELAGILGQRRAGPRDVVEIYSACLKARGTDPDIKDFEAYREQGLRLVLELMGHLAAYYRTGAGGAC
jgi:DNA-binding NarL/FixJ family response regulator